MKRLHWILFEASIEPLELWIGVVGLAWGLWILNPFIGLDQPLIRDIPQWFWALAATSSGLIQVIGCYLHRRGWRRLASAVLMATWGAASIGLIWQDWRWTTTITYPMFFLASLWVNLRVKLDAHA
jgi:hypothetical protein